MTRNCIAPLLAASMLLCTLFAANAQQGAQQAQQPAPTAQPRSNIGDDIPHSWGGLPDNAPARRQTVLPTPPVHDIPPPRGSKPLSGNQQLQLQKDLAAARTRNLSLEDPNAEKKAEKAAAANAAAIAGARKKAGKPASNPPK